MVGSAYYIAPEIVKKRGYDERVDIWSLGIVMYLLLTGETPFQSENTEMLFREIVTKKVTYDDAIWSKLSKECKDLNMKMLQSIPSKRLSAAQALSHPWFSVPEPCKIRQKLLAGKGGGNILHN